MRALFLAGFIGSVTCVLACAGQPPTAPALATYRVSGAVSEVGGGAVAGARIKPAIGYAVFSDATGFFSFPYPVAASGRSASVEAEGYEVSGTSWALVSEDVTVDPIMLERILIVSDISSLSTTLFPADYGQYVGDPYDSEYCRPCKFIRLRTDVAELVRVEVRWSSTDALHVWAGAGSVTGVAEPGRSDVTVLVRVRAGETSVYVGLPLKGNDLQRLQQPVPFELKTSVAVTGGS